MGRRFEPVREQPALRVAAATVLAGLGVAAIWVVFARGRCLQWRAAHRAAAVPGTTRQAPVDGDAAAGDQPVHGAAIDDSSVLAIDDALAALEAEAFATGSALGVAEGYPVSPERLRRWAATLGAKGLVLARLSAVLIERAGLAGAPSEEGRRAAARSQG